MKKFKRWRFGCGFCSKTTGTEASMVKHENGCTNNPSRYCGMCEKQGEVQLSSEELLEVFSTLKGEDALKKLRKITHNCPACILSASRQYDNELKLENCPPTMLPTIPWFDWKKEVAEFWARNPFDDHYPSDYIGGY